MKVHFARLSITTFLGGYNKQMDSLLGHMEHLCIYRRSYATLFTLTDHYFIGFPELTLLVIPYGSVKLSFSRSISYPKLIFIAHSSAKIQFHPSMIRIQTTECLFKDWRGLSNRNRQTFLSNHPHLHTRSLHSGDSRTNFQIRQTGRQGKKCIVFNNAFKSSWFYDNKT